MRDSLHFAWWLEVREGQSPFRVVVGNREGDEKCAADPLLQQRDMGNFGPSLGGIRLFRPVIALSGANPLILSVMSCM